MKHNETEEAHLLIFYSEECVQSEVSLQFLGISLLSPSLPPSLCVCVHINVHAK